MTERGRVDHSRSAEYLISPPGALAPALARVFCPRCRTLAPDERCPACGWQRPAPDLPVRRAAVLSTRLDTDLTAHADTLVLTADDGEIVLIDRFTLAVRARIEIQIAGRYFVPCTQLVADESRFYLGATYGGHPGSGTAFLVALDRHHLGGAWDPRPVQALQVSAPVLHDGVLFCAASTAEAWAVSSATGNLLWPAPAKLPGWSPEAPAVTESLAIFPTRGPSVLALDRHTGQERWRFNIAPSAAGLPVTPTVYKGRVYVAGWDGNLHCLDLQDGQTLRPPYRAFGGKAFLTQPVVAGAGDDFLVLVGAKDHCLHAVDAAGARRWTFDAGGSVYSRPVVVEDVVYAASYSNRALHVLDLYTGRPLRPSLELSAGVRMALTSDGVSVIAGDQHGTLWQIACYVTSLGEAATYEKAHRFDQAVTVHVKAGRWQQAADLSARELNQPDLTAQLYERAGLAVAAAQEHERAGRLGDAERLYASKQQWSEAARLAEARGHLIDAARFWEQGRDWAAAAPCYERAGEHAKAGELYHRAGNLTAARRCYEAGGDRAAAAEALFRQGRWMEAAVLFQESGQLVRAVESYLQAGDRAKAVELCLRLGEYQRAAQLWEQAGVLDEAVRCLLLDGSADALAAALPLSRRLGDWRLEAETLAQLRREREAAQLVQRRAEEREAETQGGAEQELAGLFALALAYYEAAGIAADDDDDAWRLCRHKVRYYRRLPDLEVQPQPGRQPFRGGDQNPLHVLVINRGRGKAHAVRLELRPALGALEGSLGDARSVISDLGGKWQPRLDVKTTSTGRVTLYGTLTYTDDERTVHVEQQRWEIEVMDKPVSGPQIFHIYEGGTLIQGAGEVNIVRDGDMLRDQAQKGDRVTINRGGHGAVANTTMDTLPVCTGCNHKLAAGAAYCDSCGRPVRENSARGSS